MILRISYIPDIVELSNIEILAVSREVGKEGCSLEELLQDDDFLSYLQEYLAITPRIDTAENITGQETDE